MSVLRYIAEHFTNRKARHWWKNYIRGSYVIEGLLKFLLFCGVMQLVFFRTPIIALVIVFSVATVSFFYAIYHTARRILEFVQSDLYPQDALTGYFLIGASGVIVSMLILIPTVLALSRLMNSSISLSTYVFTYFYSVSVWSFYEVIKSVRREHE